jgi:hypothetical protein
MEFISAKLSEMGASDIAITKMQLAVFALGKYGFAIRKKGKPTMFVNVADR